MVTRNRRFQTPHGYSRLHAKRDAERVVTEQLEAGPVSRPSANGEHSHPGSNSHLVLEVGPRDAARGLDLSAAAQEVGIAAAGRPVRAPAGQRGSLLGAAAAATIRGVRHACRRFVDWLSWK